jgi:hypothetical protein
MADSTTLPDFDAIAREFSRLHLHAGDSDDAINEQGIEDLARELRAVWNKRGAFDAKLIDQSLTTMMGETAADSYVKNLARILQQADDDASKTCAHDDERGSSRP